MYEYSYKPQFYCIKFGFKGVKFIYACFRDVLKYFPGEILVAH